MSVAYTWDILPIKKPRREPRAILRPYITVMLERGNKEDIFNTSES